MVGKGGSIEAFALVKELQLGLMDKGAIEAGA